MSLKMADHDQYLGQSRTWETRMCKIGIWKEPLVFPALHSSGVPPYLEFAPHGLRGSCLWNVHSGQVRFSSVCRKTKKKYLGLWVTCTLMGHMRTHGSWTTAKHRFSKIQYLFRTAICSQEQFSSHSEHYSSRARSWVTCMFVGHVHAHGSHACSWATCTLMGHMHVCGSRACSWVTCMFVGHVHAHGSQCLSTCMLVPVMTSPSQQPIKARELHHG
ncbi:hypothetical protein ANANG_G00168750 [Anguilla anguilla]|uniref:Uncharacterized protein n=1 Tax=Anguilla anguilla TaxID=7936 RepID=A0A9D3M6G0_ANGAN|nr:hypothetical protein ANANG_G00168750 [Anguilla anguilla]